MVLPGVVLHDVALPATTSRAVLSLGLDVLVHHCACAHPSYWRRFPGCLGSGRSPQAHPSPHHVYIPRALCSHPWVQRLLLTSYQVILQGHLQHPHHRTQEARRSKLTLSVLGCTKAPESSRERDMGACSCPERGNDHCWSTAIQPGGSLRAAACLSSSRQCRPQDSAVSCPLQVFRPKAPRSCFSRAARALCVLDGGCGLIYCRLCSRCLGRAGPGRG